MKISPKTWSRFNRIQDGKEIKFRIQEVSEAMYEEVLDLFMKFHTPEEPLRIISGVSNNEAALEEFRRIMLEIMMHEKQQILVCCLDDESDDVKLVAASKMTLIERNASKLVHDYRIRTKEVQNFFKVRESLYSAYNVLKHHLEDAYFADRGLVVDPTYRGMGIAEELLKARAKVCRFNSVSLYTGLATAVSSQKIAEKLGAKTVRELNLEDFARDAGLAFDGGPMMVKLMVGRIPA